MKSKQGFTVLDFVVVMLFVFGVGGWIANMYKIVQSSFDVITGMFIARCIGVFVAPLGAVLGWL